MGSGAGTPPEPIATPNRRSTRPNVGWTVEQRATVKRYMLFATILSVVGVVLSIILILIGNTGGWIVLGMIVCMYGGWLHVHPKQGGEPTLNHLQLVRRRCRENGRMGASQGFLVGDMAAMRGPPGRQLLNQGWLFDPLFVLPTGG